MARGRKKTKIKEEVSDKPFSEYSIPDEFTEVIEVKASDPKTDAFPVAEKNEVVLQTETTEALVNTRKFIGGRWWNLEVGQLLTAPKEVIESLRRGKFVK